MYRLLRWPPLDVSTGGMYVWGEEVKPFSSVSVESVQSSQIVGDMQFFGAVTHFFGDGYQLFAAVLLSP